MWHIVCRLFLILLMVSLAINLPLHAAQAQQESIELEATYSRIESATPTDGFQFVVTVSYQGSEARTFDLQTRGPEGWTTYVTPSYGSTRISAIELQPNMAHPDQVKVTALPPIDYSPAQPGEYTITLLCSSGTVGSSIDLIAVVIPNYSMSVTVNRWKHEIRAGKDNILSMSIRNTGNEVLSNIRFSSRKPEGWVISFEPTEIHYLEPDNIQVFDMIIRPDAKTAARSYKITVIAESDQTLSQKDFVVNVEPSTMVYLWVGAIAICVLIAVFVVVFLRFGRQQTRGPRNSL